MQEKIIKAATIVMSSLAAFPAAAQSPAPTIEIKAALSKDTAAALCDGTAFQPGPMIGELASAYKLNVFALPALPAGAGIAAPDTVEGRAAGWLVYRQRADFDSKALRAGQADLLEQIGTDLTDYVDWLGRNAKQPFVRASDQTIPLVYEAPLAQRASRRAEILARLFSRFLGTGVAQPVLQCAPAPVVDVGGGKRPGGQDTKTAFLVRGKIEDLTIPQKGPGDKFKGASSASIAFTDNHEKGETSVVIDGTIAAGYQNGRIESLLGFLRYTQNTTETATVGDDDDSKDIRALSPGIVYSRRIGLGQTLYGTFGLTAFPTFDFAQKARTGRVRLFLDDIAISGVGRGPLCDRSDRIGTLEYSCRLGVFAEGAHVWRAGTSKDLATLEDDQYLGFGGNLRIGLSLPEIKALQPFSLVGEYRYMAVVSGPLDDPHRLSLALNYKLTSANLTFGIGYDEGSNFDTFQRERLTKVTVGFKY